jgi:predicted O-methyltransferase YrrM
VAKKMIDLVQLAFKYLNYYLTASNGKGHGIHSPFFYNFVRNVLMDKRQYYAYQQVEQYRNFLLKDQQVVEVKDLGAGSMLSKSNSRTVAEICRNTSKSKKLGQLLFRCSNYFKPKSIVELGTSLGVSTAYLAAGSPAANITTCEGSDAVASIAINNLHEMGLKNIRMLQGNFDDTLPEFILQNPSLDMIFVDGNHREEPTIRYFEWFLPCMHEGSVMIFDDIHWSEGMEKAWETIKEHPAVTITIDLFFIGLVFFSKDFKAKQHFTIRY